MATTISNTSVNFNDGTQQETAFKGHSANVFTSNGTFAVPTGITKIKITAVGAGGGSSGGSGLNGKGGGGGGTSFKWLTVTPGSSFTVTVGIGGSGAATSTGSGSAGSNSSFSNGSPVTYYARGVGGSGGTFGGQAGSGGSSDSGDINIRGSDGVTAYYSETSVSGSQVPDTYRNIGGGTFLAPSQAIYSTASAGYSYGGGGSPGLSGAGASGANGIVIIEY